MQYLIKLAFTEELAAKTLEPFCCEAGSPPQNPPSLCRNPKQLLHSSLFLRRKLTKFKNKVGVLQTETTALRNAVAIFQNEVAGLKSENAKLRDANVKQKFEIELTGQMINKVSESTSLNNVHKGK